MDPGKIVTDLENAAKALDQASTRLSNATKEFEGWYERVESVDPSTGEIVVKRGAWSPGPQLRWRIAVSEAIDRIVEEKFADGRPPAVERLERMAELRVMHEEPDLFADYHRLQTEINALQKWISAKKETISARQSVLKAEKELAR